MQRTVISSLVLVFLLSVGGAFAGEVAAPAVLATFDDPVAAVLAHEGDPNWLFAVAGPNLHVSTDGGKTWTAREAPFLLAGDRILLPDVASREGVFLLCGNQVSRFSPGKVFRTRNAGVLWTQLAPKVPDLQIGSFVQSRANPEVFYAADASGKIYTSTDGGETWAVLEAARFLNHRIGSIATFASSKRSLVVVATPWDTPCPCGSVYRSIDGGLSWEKVVPVVDAAGREVVPGVGSLRFSQKNSKVIWGVESFLSIYSEDGGETWKELRDGEEIRTEAVQNVLLDPDDPRIVYLFREKIWRGDLGTGKWETVLDPGMPVAALSVRGAGEKKTFLFASGKSVYEAPIPARGRAR